MRAILYLIFAISGAAGLIYEVAWSKYLGLFLGHSAYAQTVVISIFLGGMSAGAWGASRISTRIRRPLLAYAILEGLIGLLGLLFHPLFVRLLDLVYATLPGIGQGAAGQALQWGIGAAAILPSSVLLGATFPVLAAAVIRTWPGENGRILGSLYFSNSIGAAIGALIAGFVLIPGAGLPGSMAGAAIANLIVAVIAVLVSKQREQVGDPALITRVAFAGQNRLRPALLIIAGLTAVASFVYEIAWIRMLSLVMGSASHSFELMLSAFILGLALGARWARKRIDRWQDPAMVLVVVQVVMGIAALATLPLYINLFGVTTYLLQLFAETPAGYAGYNAARYVMAISIMLPSTFCAGITLPLITHILLQSGEDESVIGRVYGINTLGSIAGVAFAALLALPLLGVKGTLVAGAAVDVGAGLGLLALAGRASMLRYATPVAVVLLSLPLLTPLDTTILSSGVYRSGLVRVRGEVDVDFYRDGRTATVAVRRSPSGHRSITTNGKPDASLGVHWGSQCPERRQPYTADEATQLLAPLVGLAHAPRASALAVIGHGSGMSAQTILASQIGDSVVSVEIEPMMVAGSREFYPANALVFDDPRSKIRIADARSYFAAGGHGFDFIFSEPSNPWVSGVASLFTTEFYSLIGRSLSDEGVFAQWLHLYEISNELVMSVLTALHESFSDYRLYLTNGTDMLIVAKPDGNLPSPDWGTFRAGALPEYLCHFEEIPAPMLDASLLMSRRSLGPLLDVWPAINSDFYPVLDVGAERARYLGGRAYWFTDVTAGINPIHAWEGLTVDTVSHQSSPVQGIPAMEMLARGALIRAHMANSVDADSIVNPALSRALYRTESFFRSLEGPRPARWDTWFSEFRFAHEYTYGGANSGASEDLFTTAGEFLVRQDAPDHLQLVYEFKRELERRRWDRASELAVSLVAVPSASVYLPIEDLYAFGVTAALLADAPGRAVQIHRALVEAVSQSPGIYVRLAGAWMNDVLTRN